MFDKNKENNIIDEYLKKANTIERDNAYNYKYTYWVATPNGMRLDVARNHEYGEDRVGYEKWKNNEPQSWYAEHAGQISLRPVIDRKDGNAIVGYITEERRSDYLWQQEIKALVDECFDKLCEVLHVNDVENFRYFIFSDLGLFKDYKMELRTRLDIMVEVYERYNECDDYKRLICKIKG